MPRLASHLSYRTVDVTTVKELCRRWLPETFEKVPKKKVNHRYPTATVGPTAPLTIVCTCVLVGWWEGRGNCKWGVFCLLGFQQKNKGNLRVKLSNIQVLNCGFSALGLLLYIAYIPHLLVIFHFKSFYNYRYFRVFSINVGFASFSEL